MAFLSRKNGCRALALLCVAWISACSSAPPQTESIESETLTFNLSMSSETYETAQAAVATVEIANVSEVEEEIRFLNFDSLEFYLTSKGKNRQLIRTPVYSKNENPLGTLALFPGAKETRRFLFTLLTEEEGEFLLNAGFSPSMAMPVPPDASEKERRRLLQKKAIVWSNPVAFRVKGLPTIKRDGKGVLEKESAVEMCVDLVDYIPEKTETQLIWDDKGFLVWWVCLTPPGDSAKQAWFVNPYLGKINAEVQAPLSLTE